MHDLHFPLFKYIYFKNIKYFRFTYIEGSLITTRNEQKCEIERSITLKNLCEETVIMKDVEYKLRAVIHHTGESTMEGHYYADVEYGHNDFMRANDSDVSNNYKIY